MSVCIECWYSDSVSRPEYEKAHSVNGQMWCHIRKEYIDQFRVSCESFDHYDNHNYPVYQPKED